MTADLPRTWPLFWFCSFIMGLNLGAAIGYAATGAPAVGVIAFAFGALFAWLAYSSCPAIGDG